MMNEVVLNCVETHTSSSDDSANFGKHLLSWNGLHAAGANFIAAPDRFRRPDPVYLVGVGQVEALHDSLGKQGSRGRGKPHRFSGKLI